MNAVFHYGLKRDGEARIDHTFRHDAVGGVIDVMVMEVFIQQIVGADGDTTHAPVEAIADGGIDHPEAVDAGVGELCRGVIEASRLIKMGRRQSCCEAFW